MVKVNYKNRVLINYQQEIIMSNQFKFECQFCGEEFGKNVVNLALHIGKIHDSPRSKIKNRK